MRELKDALARDETLLNTLTEMLKKALNKNDRMTANF